VIDTRGYHIARRVFFDFLNDGRSDQSVHDAGFYDLTDLAVKRLDDMTRTLRSKYSKSI
jgi:hypothetical protein